MKTKLYFSRFMQRAAVTQALNASRAAVLLLVMLLTATTAWADGNGSCGDGVTWSYNDVTKTLTIAKTGDGTGAMTDYDHDYPGWYNNYRTSITSVVIESGVTSIGNGAFDESSALTSVTIGNSVTSIGDDAFEYCTSLASVTIPNSVTSIGVQAFAGCTSLASVTIGSGVQTIGDYAFADCSVLTSITFYATSVPTLGEDVFDGCAAGRKIYVPAGSVDTYKEQATTMGVNPNDIVGFDTNTCGDNVYYSYDSSTTTLNIFGTGAMANYVSNSQPWNSYKADITSVVIGSGVTHIGNNAFNGCNNANFTSIEIPANVTSIGESAFADCTSLTSVTIYAPGLEYYGSNAFANNASGRKIYVPMASLDTYQTNWSAYAGDIVGFNGTCGATGHESDVRWAYKAGTLTIMKVGSTGAMADFANVDAQPWKDYRTSITSVVIEDGVTGIGNHAFDGCSALTTVTIYATSVPTLGSNAFNNCNSLAKIYVFSDLVSTYQGADNWSAYSSIIEAMFSISGNCGAKNHEADVTWRLEGTAGHYRLTISGTGPMADYEFATPWDSYRSDITTVVIEDGVMSIGNTAFVVCTSLTSVTIPSSVISIGRNAFDGCSALTSVTIGNSVESIGNGAFMGCSALTSVTIGNGVTSISGNAFRDCTSLTSIEIPASVTSIGMNAFNGCSALTSITIPASVESIGDDAFAGCSSLTSINVDANNANYASEDGVLFNKAKTTLFQYPIGKSGTAYAIPASVTSIGNNAFYGCSALTSVTIPANVTSIGNNAFYGCSALTSVTIYAPSLTKYGIYAFYNNASGRKIYVYYNCMGTYKQAENWSSYASAIEPIIDGTCGTNVNYSYDNTTKTLCIFGTGAMTNYASGDEPWNSYKANITSVVIGDGVTSIGIAPFAHCPGLETFTVESGNTTYRSEGNCLIEKDSHTLVQGCKNSIIPADVTSIGESAFWGCTSLTSIEIPANVTSIGDYAFSGCSNLASVTIYAPSLNTYGSSAFAGNASGRKIYVFSDCVDTYKAGWSVYASYIVAISIVGSCGASVTWELIPTSTFSVLTISGTGAMADFANVDAQPWKDYRTSITAVVIEDGVTHIGNHAFDGCSALTTVTIYATSVPTLGNNAFNNCNSLAKIYVLSDLVSTYQGADNWSSYSSKIEPMAPAASGTCGDNLTWQLERTTGNYKLFISGTGAMADYIEDGAPWYSYRSDITSVVIGNGVTSIGNYAFWGCSALTSIEIPANVTRIGYSAFLDCTSLKSVTIYAPSLTDYGTNAFANNADGRKIYVYYDCVDTYKAGWPDYADDIVAMAPAASGTCGDNLTWQLERTTGNYKLFISGTGAMNDYSEDDVPWYSYRSDITSVDIGDGVTSIGNSAFAGCSALPNIKIPANVTSIGNSAFAGCTSLLFLNSEATTPPTLGSNALNGCTALNAILVPAGTASAYKKADKWSDYTDIIFDDYGTCGTGVYYAYDSSTKTLNIFGTGAMADYLGYDALPWYNYSADITSVVIGSGVTHIGNFAFEDCTALTSVTIGNSVTSIGIYAFWGCTSLTSITIPNSVTSIGDFAFNNCSALTSVTIGNGVTSIGLGAFQGCSALTSITIGSSVTSIGDYALDGCSALTSIEIPASVTSIGYKAFDRCTSLTSINVDANNATYASEDGVLFNKAKTTLIQYPIGKSGTTYAIPASVTSIDDYAFYDCRKLASVTIPNSVTSIGDYAFDGCSALTSIEIPASMTSIGYKAFAGCTSLTSINVDANNATYASEDGVLFNKAKTTLIQYPIGKSGTAYAIPASVTSIGNTAFYGCSALTSVEIPANVTSIGNYAFDGCTALTSIEIPANVTSIGDNAFDGCTALTSVTIGNSVESIGSDAFNGCSALTSVTIPANVTSIGYNTFYGCTGLTSVTIYATTPPILGLNPFAGNADGRKIYVFSDCVETYRAKASKLGVDEDDIVAIEGIALADAADNSALITAGDGATLAVTLQGRTLYKDGAWNTLCLPFSLTAEQIAAHADFAGATLKELDTEGKNGFDPTNGTLWLTFKTATEIAAGVPYIVKWDKAADYDSNASDYDITSPTFSDVTIEATASTTVSDADEGLTEVQMVGCYSPVPVEANDKSILFLGDANTLYYSSVDRNIRSCRAYFSVPYIKGNAKAMARAFHLDFGDGEQTGITTTNYTNFTNDDDAWYSLDGRRLAGKPTKSGVYINNGKKVVIK